MTSALSSFFYRNRIVGRCTVGVIAVITSLCLCSSFAYADVRKADVVMGSTVEARGLSVAQCPNVDADFVMVMGADGTVYFERDAQSFTQIASITKIMTAAVAVDCAPLDTPLTVSDNAAMVGESSAALQSGDTLTLQEALKALLIPSGNDAALTIAEGVGAILLQNQGADASDPSACNQAFIDKMNETSATLGLTDTVFRNAHGLDDGEYAGDQHSCAADVAQIAKYVMAKNELRTIVAGGDGTCSVTRDGVKRAIELTSTDELIGVYEGTCGIKTGYTDLAGYSFAGANNRGDQDIYAIVIHSSSSSQRFTDTQTLWDWVYDHDIQYKLINVPSTIADASGNGVPLVAEVAHTEWMDKTVKATVADPAATVELFDLDGNVSQSVEYDTITGDVKAGQKVGTITFKQRNNVIATRDLISVEAVSGPNILEGFAIWWQRLFGGFSGDPGVAESVNYNDTPLINDKAS